MYSATVFYLANLICQARPSNAPYPYPQPYPYPYPSHLPLEALPQLCFGAVTYFMIGLKSTGAAFFIYTVSGDCTCGDVRVVMVSVVMVSVAIVSVAMVSVAMVSVAMVSGE